MFLGFYDWLRTATGDVVGVQILFHEGREHVQNVLRRARVGNLDGDWFFQVVFEDGLPLILKNPSTKSSLFPVATKLTTEA
jgi:hypothetical protein